MNPTHIVGDAFDRDAICGAVHAIPRVSAEFVDHHIANYGLVICADCHLIWAGVPQQVPGQMGLFA